MKKRIITTPFKFYLIGGLVLCATLVGWLVLYFGFKDKLSNDFAIEVLKNSFFAIFGSFLVALLIDIGNTHRENTTEDKAFVLLKPYLLSIYDILAPTAFLYEKCFVISEDGTIELINYYNNEFSYRRKNVIEFKKLETLSSFVETCKSIIQRMKQSSYYENLSKPVKELIDEIQVKGFPMLIDLSERNLKLIKIPGMKKEIERLSKISLELSKTLDTKIEFTILTKEEADDYYERKQKFIKQNAVFLSGITGKTVYRGDKRIK